MLSQRFTAFQTYKLNIPQLNSFVKSQPNGEASLTLHFGETNVWPITLQQHEIRSGNFLMTLQTANGTLVERKGECNTYKGFLTNDPTQHVRLYISENFIRGSVLSGGVMFIIEPLAVYLGPDATFNQDILVYKRKDAFTETIECFTEGLDGFNGPLVDTREDCEHPDCSVYGFPNVERHLELAIETDCEFFQKFMDLFQGQPNQFEMAKEAATSDIEHKVMDVDAYYTEAINLHSYLVHINLWTNCNIPETNDPYVGNSMPGHWDAVRSYWNATKTWVQRDHVHFFSGKNLSPGNGVVNGNQGFSGVGSICGRNNDLVGPPNFTDSRHESYTVSDGNSGFHTFAHEIGHALGMGHTCDCGLMHSSSACIGTPPYCTPSDCMSHSITGNSSHWRLCNTLNSFDFAWGYPHDACLVSPPPTSPDFDIVITKTSVPGGVVGEDGVICLGESMDVSFTNTFNNYNATWNLGPGLAFVTPPTGTTVHVMVTTNSPMTSFVSATFDYNGNTFTFMRHLHIGVPLPVGPPIISSEYFPFTGNVFSVGFPMPPGADFIEYSYTVTIPNQPQNAYNGTTTNANPLVTGLPQNACVSFHLYPGNGCGINYNPPYPSIDICFGGNPIMAAPGNNTEQVSHQKSKLLSSVHYGVAENIVVYPNPAHQRFYVSLSQPSQSLVLRATDANGRTLYQEDFTEVVDAIAIEAAEWPNGVYMLQAIQGDYVQLKKLIVQH